MDWVYHRCLQHQWHKFRIQQKTTTFEVYWAKITEISGNKKALTTNKETEGIKKSQSTAMKKVTMSKSPSNGGYRGSQSREGRMRSRLSKKTQLVILEATRGRRSDRSRSRADNVGKTSSRPNMSWSRSRDKKTELKGPKGAQVKLEMIESSESHQKSQTKRKMESEEVILISSTEDR